MTSLERSAGPRGSTSAGAGSGGGWPYALERLTEATALALGFADASLAVLEHDQSRVGTLRIAAGRRNAHVTPSLADLDTQVLASGEPGLLLRRNGHTEISPWPPTGHTEDTLTHYLGVAVTTTSGTALGVLSVTDDVPCGVGADQVRLLEELARLAAGLIVLARDSDDPTLLDDDTRAVARAVENGQIVPWYQPVIDLATGQVVGFEALARWPGGRPDGRTNAAFVEIAERSDLVIALDHAVVAQALADLSRWRQDRPLLRLSVNLSGRHLEHEDWLDVIDAAAQRNRVPPDAVDLELTETVGPSSTDAVADARTRGYRVVLDDFGSGWSGLHELVHTPVDGIKLDLSFARSLGTHTDDAVIKALTTAAEQLGMWVTIEGIETGAQARRARELGCHLAQGYLWSPAVPTDDLEDLITRLDAASTV